MRQYLGAKIHIAGKRCSLTVGCGVRKYTMLAKCAHSFKWGMTSFGIALSQTSDDCGFI